VGEEATDAADAKAFCTLLHLPEIQKLQYLPSAGVVVAAVVVATACCILVATTIELKPN